MWGKILIFALLGCSLVLASPVRKDDFLLAKIPGFLDKDKGAIVVTDSDVGEDDFPRRPSPAFPDPYRHAYLLNSYKGDNNGGITAEDRAEWARRGIQPRDFGQFRNVGGVGVERQPINDGFFGRVGKKVGGQAGGAVDKLVGNPLGKVGGLLGNAFNQVKDSVGDRYNQVKNVDENRYDAFIQPFGNGGIAFGR